MDPMGNIIQMGWFNHQLVYLYAYIYLFFNGK